ncbi:hypothetical protein [Leptospira stimsonii]|nr:hypothetical protein [Leptospira stimsonii]
MDHMETKEQNRAFVRAYYMLDTHPLKALIMLKNMGWQVEEYEFENEEWKLIESNFREFSQIIRVFEIQPYEGANHCTEKNPKDVLVWLEEAEPGEEIIIRTKEMTEHEYANLPEYEGP